MPSQLRDPFTMEDPTTTEGSSDRLATVTPLYREAATPPNMGPQIRAPYAEAPPPVVMPYGWRMVRTPAGWMAQHEPAEWAVIARCVEGRRAGRPFTDIVAELVAEDAPIWHEGTRDYGVEPRWHWQRVRRLVKRYAPELETAPRAGKKTRTRVQSAAPRDLSYKDDLEELLALAEAADALETPVP